MTLDGTHLYRRNLPHVQKNARTYFVTFCTRRDRLLSPEARSIVLKYCRGRHERTYFLHCAVVMPDHAHLIITPFPDGKGDCLPLNRIMKGIKGGSAREINRLSGTRGAIWQAESFDHLLRNCESIEEKVEYVCRNPVRKGLAAQPEEYPWLWRYSTQNV